MNELSKKVGYVRGLMAGLSVDESTSEGKVLNAMADLLEEMSQAIADLSEENDMLIRQYVLNEIDNAPDDEEAENIIDDLEISQPDEELDEDELLDEISEKIENELAAEQELDLADDIINLTKEQVGSEIKEAKSKLDEQSKKSEALKEQPFQEEVPPVIQSEQHNEGEQEDIAYECPCPVCHNSFPLTTEQLNRGSAHCPFCGTHLEFEL
ncbi:MAG: hypothetical protein LUE12_02260 [Ruminococcus sp.]|nr:hypothetical protein [Ruminococcus sp.]